MTACWIVLEATLSTEARTHGMQVSYPFHVGGINLSANGHPAFRWNVPSVKDERYDFTNALMDAETRAAVEAERAS